MERTRLTSRILYFRNQANLGKIGDAFVHATPTAQPGELLDQGRGNDFMVLAALLNLCREDLAWVSRQVLRMATIRLTPAKTRQSSLVK